MNIKEWDISIQSPSVPGLAMSKAVINACLGYCHKEISISIVVVFVYDVG